jgi:glycosyltransferase involved in cell wall biosynthesis
VTAKDQPFPPTLPVEVPDERIIYTRWINVNKPAEIVFGGRQSITVRGLESRGYLGSGETRLRRLYRHLYKRFVSFPDDQIGWFPFACTAASQLLKKWKPDVIYASAMPFTSLLVAHRLSKKYSIPWVADLRDLWVDHQNYKHYGWRRVVEEKVERRTLSSAAGLVTVSEPLAEVLRRKYTAPVSLVLNGFDYSDYPEALEPVNRDRKVRIVYTGTIYEGKQDIEPLFQAIAGMESRDQVRVILYGRYLQAARRLAAKYEIESLVQAHEAMPYQDALRAQREADVLLLLLWNDLRERGIYTGKLFEYIGAGRPILAVGPANNVAADLIAERKVGVVVQSPADIAGQLQKWVVQKGFGGAISPAPPNAGLGLSREEQARKLERFLLDIVTGKASTS